MSKQHEDDDDTTRAARTQRLSASDVIAAVGRDAARLSGDHDRWLAEIHRAPQDRWASLVQECLEHSLDLKTLKERVTDLRPKKAATKERPSAAESDEVAETAESDEADQPA